MADDVVGGRGGAGGVAAGGYVAVPARGAGRIDYVSTPPVALPAAFP